jgi:thiol-disulfide isomerase/thioredoxin
MRSLIFALTLALVTPALAVEVTPPADRAKAAKLSIKSLQGKRFKLKKLKGQVVIVNFWATWCAPCMQELPFLDGFHEKYGKKGLTVMAISNDGPETASRVRGVVKQRKFKMPTFHDKSGQVMASHNPRGGNPYTVFIDKKGRVAYAHEGYTPGDEKKYEEIITALLAE